MIPTTIPIDGAAGVMTAIQPAAALTVIHAPQQNSKALFLNGQLVVWADPAQDDPLHLIDEAAQHLANSFGVDVRYLTGDLSHLLN